VRSSGESVALTKIFSWVCVDLGTFDRRKVGRPFSISFSLSRWPVDFNRMKKESYSK
jgi:hypothetical protein